MPFFSQLGCSISTSVATGFAIQCCGMTAGAVTWWAFYRQMKMPQAVYWPVVLFAGAGAIVGVLAKQPVLYFSAKNLKLFFAGWIVILGVSALPL